MSAPYKLLIFLKRRPGLSLAAFRHDYETRHVPLCLRYAAGAVRYVRRYVEPLPDAGGGVAGELDFDVVTETWFDDRVVFDRVVAAMARGLVPPDVLADEELLFDRSRSRFATVTEEETPPVALAPPR